MDYNSALVKMKEGFDVALPGQEQFRSWDFLQGKVLVHSKEGLVVDVLSPTHVKGAGLLRNDWQIRHPQQPANEDRFPEWWEEVDFEPEEPRILKRGDRSDDVLALQRALTNQGFSLGTPDGIYGGRTEKAVKDFQRAVGLVADGIFGDKTATLMEGREFPEALTQEDMLAGSRKLNCHVEAVMAVSTVESRGFGFLASARPKVLFERHVMRRQLIKHNVSPGRYIRNQPNIVNTRTGGYKGGEAEHDRINLARKINAPAGYESASWGAYQIMGYHWEHLGYESVDDYVERMYTNEGEHLDAFCRFILNDRRLLEAIRGDDPDFTTFARIYNGPAYARNNYDVKMSENFQRLMRMNEK